MAEKCEKCTENCPQAERANQAALGRMYATKEFIALLKKVESGELVEVVRCKDCKYWERGKDYEPYCNHWGNMMSDTNAEDFCSYGERREGE